METRKFILRETIILAIAEVVCVAAMVGVFALLGYFDYTVILGGVLGGSLSIANFFFMALSSNAAADKATEQKDVKAGKSAMKVSYRMRLLIIGVLLFLFAKSGHCHVLALVCPLFFVFPIIMVTEFFRKSGGSKS